MLRIVLVIISAIVGITLLLVITSLIANNYFNQSIDKEVKEFYSNVENKHDLIHEKDLNGLPEPVKRWLKYSQIVGKEKIVAARTRQEVELRLENGKPWMPATVKQYFRTDEPGFIWTVKINAAPLLHIVGRDKYIDGHGNMLIKMLSLKDIANVSGPEIDQGTLLRYFAETMWFPTAALSKYIQWEELDPNTAKATMSYKGVSASGIFTFNEKGEMLSLEAERYGDFNGQYRMETWSVSVGEYKEFNGFKIPSKGEIVWKLTTGDFKWYRFNLKEMEYNKPENF